MKSLRVSLVLAILLLLSATTVSAQTGRMACKDGSKPKVGHFACWGHGGLVAAVPKNAAKPAVKAPKLDTKTTVKVAKKDHVATPKKASKKRAHTTLVKAKKKPHPKRPAKQSAK
jgi:hypothetical protein